VARNARGQPQLAWSCEANCFSNNPQPDLQEGLGEMEVKAETLRFIACATSDLLSDAAFNVEQWLFQKVYRGFANTINNAIIIGDGLSKPLGFLHPAAGIPVCEPSASTLPIQFSWQDLVNLKYEIPLQWHANGRYFMNQLTLALILTMSVSDGRQLLTGLIEGLPDQADRRFADSDSLANARLPAWSDADYVWRSESTLFDC
jgi:HK97 family phage major capsid protein